MTTGQEFTHDGRIYVVVEGDCNGCAFSGKPVLECLNNGVPQCYEFTIDGVNQFQFKLKTND